jgi:hypothetical protein
VLDEVGLDHGVELLVYDDDEGHPITSEDDEVGFEELVEKGLELLV